MYVYLLMVQTNDGDLVSFPNGAQKLVARGAGPDAAAEWLVSCPRETRGPPRHVWRRCRARSEPSTAAEHRCPTANCFSRIADEQLGAGRRLRRPDAWIAATALRNGAAVITQDASFTSFTAVKILRV
jgi:hypothetical protein